MIKFNNKISKLVILIIGLLSLFIFQESNFLTVKNTVNIFFSSVLPSLFPFILFTNIIINCDLISSITNIFKKYSHLISIIIIGFLCGYPMGAKITYKYYIDGKITKKQANFLMSFANNCNPIFILSTIGICIFNNIHVGIILCISHYISALVIGFAYFTHNNIIHEDSQKSNSFKKNGFKNLHKSIFEIIDDSIKSSFVVLGNIFAFIVIFNIIFAAIETILIKLDVSNSLIYSLSALFEVTNGCRLIYLNSNLDFNIIICLISFMLGFSGLSIIFQIYSCIYKANIKVYHIIKYKLIQGIISFAITYIILKFKNIKTTNISLSSSLSNTLEFTSSSYFIIFVSILFVLVFAIKKVTQK